MSAWARWALRSAVLLWHWVTVQSLARRREATGVADDVAATDNDGAEAGHVCDAGVLEELDAACGGAGEEERVAGLGGEVADVERVEAVDVLLGADGLGDAALCVRVDVVAEGQLDEDAVDADVLVELADALDDVLLACAVGELDVGVAHATLFGSELLHPDVGGGCALGADLHDAEVGLEGGVLLLELCDALGDARAHLLGEGGAIDELGTAGRGCERGHGVGDQRARSRCGEAEERVGRSDERRSRRREGASVEGAGRERGRGERAGVEEEAGASLLGEGSEMDASRAAEEHANDGAGLRRGWRARARRRGEEQVRSVDRKKAKQSISALSAHLALPRPHSHSHSLSLSHSTDCSRPTSSGLLAFTAARLLQDTRLE